MLGAAAVTPGLGATAAAPVFSLASMANLNPAAVVDRPAEDCDGEAEASSPPLNAPHSGWWREGKGMPSSRRPGMSRGAAKGTEKVALLGKEKDPRGGAVG